MHRPDPFIAPSPRRRPFRAGPFCAAAVVAALGAAILPSAVLADAGCNVPMSEWQPREALEQKLTAQGWEVRRIKIDDGCYEVYAIDPQGGRAEVYFDPRTLQPVRGDDAYDRDDRDHGDRDGGAGHDERRG